MGARVVVLDRSLDRLRYLDDIFMGRIETVWSSAAALEEQVMDADLIIGAVLIPGAAAPKLVSRDLVSKLQKGSVMVDVAIDQGGCFETSRATSYQDPVYEVDGVVLLRGKHARWSGENGNLGTHQCHAALRGALSR